MQVPFWQVSVWVQPFPSLHVAPLGRAVLIHVPVAVLQALEWHESEGVQITILPLVQVPFWQVSF